MGLFDRRKVAVPTAPPKPQKPQLPGKTQWNDGFGRVATRSVQIIAVLIVVAGLIFGMTQLSLVFIPIVIALILASAINPFMNWMRAHRVPDILATWIALLALLAILGGVGWLIVNAVRNQWSALVDSAQDGVLRVQEELAHLPFAISTEQLESIQKTATDFITSSQFGSGALAGVSAATSFITGLLLMVVVLFFFLKDGPRIWEFILRPFTGEQYERARRIGDKTVSTLGGYVRGTSIVAAVDAIGIGVALAILGVPLALPLSVIVFLSSFIPLVGATVAGALAALVALVADRKSVV